MLKRQKNLLFTLLLVTVLLLCFCVTALASEGEPGEKVPEAISSITENTEEGTEIAAQPAEGGEAETCTLRFYDYDGKLLSEQKNFTVGDCVSTVPVSDYLEGNSVAYWMCESDVIAAADLTSYKVEQYGTEDDCCFYAVWKVSYLDSDGATVIDCEYVKNGESPVHAPACTDSGADVTNWLNDGKTFVLLSQQKITGDTSFTAWISPGLSETHTAYISGYSTKDSSTGVSCVYQFKPENSLTRAAAAQMIYNLLQDKTLGSFACSFSDVTSGKWYYTPVTVLASQGLLGGYEKNGTLCFKPNQAITRAEFVKILCLLFPLEESSSSFTDVPTGRWYYSYVSTATVKGWVNGYGDGSFRPGKAITRAEAVKILNRVLNRVPDEQAISKLSSVPFIDICDSWAYKEIIEAATDVGYATTGSGLSAGIHNIDGTLYYVESNGCFSRGSKGVNQLSNGKYYYFAKDGVAIKVRSAGVYNLGGKLYLIGSDYAIIHDPLTNYETRTYEYNGYLYYIQTDGSLLSNGYYGSCYFGSNGVYTSGDSTLDIMVYNLLEDALSDSSMSQRNKLLYGYLAIRDYTQNTLGSGYVGYFRYSNLNSYTHQELAIHFLQYKKGCCVEYAEIMRYVACRIGYNATLIDGKLSSGATHEWVVVSLGGYEYLLDVEQDWGYYYGYYQSSNKARAYRDCFMTSYASNTTLYYGSRYGSSYATRNSWSPYRN